MNELKKLGWIKISTDADTGYFFSGKIIQTQGVISKLSLQEMAAIGKDIRRQVEESNGLGIDYLQVYSNEDGLMVFFQDALKKAWIENGDSDEAHNISTLMLASEY